MAPRQGFWLLCRCGRRVEFDERRRGRVVRCECGLGFQVPHRASWGRRLVGRVRWTWRYVIAGRHLHGVGVAALPFRAGALRVACPRCHVAPPDAPVWQCEFCLCAWNTFDTRGRCPGCGFRYPATMCTSCGEMSRHADWYLPTP